MDAESASPVAAAETKEVDVEVNGKEQARLQYVVNNAQLSDADLLNKYDGGAKGKGKGGKKEDAAVLEEFKQKNFEDAINILCDRMQEKCESMLKRSIGKKHPLFAKQKQDYKAEKAWRKANKGTWASRKAANPGSWRHEPFKHRVINIISLAAGAFENLHWDSLSDMCAEPTAKAPLNAGHAKTLLSIMAGQYQPLLEPSTRDTLMWLLNSHNPADFQSKMCGLIFFVRLCSDNIIAERTASASAAAGRPTTSGTRPAAAAPQAADVWGWPSSDDPPLEWNALQREVEGDLHDKGNVLCANANIRWAITLLIFQKVEELQDHPEFVRALCGALHVHKTLQRPLMDLVTVACATATSDEKWYATSRLCSRIGINPSFAFCFVVGSSAHVTVEDLEGALKPLCEQLNANAHLVAVIMMVIRATKAGKVDGQASLLNHFLASHKELGMGVTTLMRWGCAVFDGDAILQTKIPKDKVGGVIGCVELVCLS